MSDVKRYDMCGHDAYDEPHEQGHWVIFEDYAALEARLAEVEADRLEAEEKLKREVLRHDDTCQQLAKETGYKLDYKAAYEETVQQLHAAFDVEQKS